MRPSSCARTSSSFWTLPSRPIRGRLPPMSDGGRLAQVFVHNLPSPSDERDLTPLANELIAITTAARAAWPGVEVDPERYVAFVAERIWQDGPLTEGLQRLRTS